MQVHGSAASGTPNIKTSALLRRAKRRARHMCWRRSIPSSRVLVGGEVGTRSTSHRSYRGDPISRGRGLSVDRHINWRRSRLEAFLGRADGIRRKEAEREIVAFQEGDTHCRVFDVLDRFLLSSRRSLMVWSIQLVNKDSATGTVRLF